ncbi:MBL fold metallo-hydrolase [Rhodococcus wratislaviensis]|uniref:MBL fold metallo-hydrolase n=1 Tax=Rhodococcus wratislaviensis TaxID=44752 RepID=UPI00135AD800|nr:MBL fold metallo-hydrolase [Rhodococcus wratislaviensis]
MDILITGYPGVSPSNGGMGWSSVGLVRTGERIVLVDTGPFGARDLLRRRLAEHGVAPDEVTDVVLTHCHHDHSVNWTMFPNARVYVSRIEMEWALRVPHGEGPVPELYVRELASSPATTLLEDGDEIVPGIRAELVPGHTPGSLIVTVDHEDTRTIFLGDAAKNRAELVCRRADATLDAPLSRDSIARIWTRWEEVPNTTVIPGHDLPMGLIEGECHYQAVRQTSVQARLSADFDDLTTFDLSET